MSYGTPAYLKQYHEELMKSLNVKYKMKKRAISLYHNRTKLRRMPGMFDDQC